MSDCASGAFVQSRFLLIFSLSCTWFATALVAAQGHYKSHRPDSHAPIGVMGDHAHQLGEVMISYRYMRMEMDGNRDGTTRLSQPQVLKDFMVAPIGMTMEMHMFGAMYAASEDITFMAMVPYIQNTMDHINRMGVRFTTRSEGLGDIRLSGLIPIHREENHRVHLNAGVSVPTGSIDETDATPAGPDQLLPYPMQLGSGTWDLLPGITWMGQTRSWSYGAQALATIRIDDNDNGYTLGDRYDLNVWGAYQWAGWLSSSVRLQGSHWDNIQGNDPQLNPLMVPTADPSRRRGQRIDLGVGLNFYVDQGALEGNRFAVEFLFPVHQDLTGPQLEIDWTLIAGWQLSF